LWELHDALQPRRVSRTSLAAAERACAVLDSRYAELPSTIVLPELRRQPNHVVGWMRTAAGVTADAVRHARSSTLRGWLRMAEHQGRTRFTVAQRGPEADDNDLAAGCSAQSLIPVDGSDGDRGP
jgi:hypothetical protein